MPVKLRAVKEVGIHGGLLACALVSILCTAGIIGVLAVESLAFFRAVSPLEFFGGLHWSPLLEPRRFGVLPLVCGTFLVAGGALVVALPIGLASAIFLSEHAPPAARGVIKPALEVLAGVPTVVYGYFALTFITPYCLRPCSRPSKCSTGPARRWWWAS